MRRFYPRPHLKAQRNVAPKAGFTLIELLVAISILTLLTVMTFSIVNITQDEDRVRSGSAQVQSYLEGARDRAIQAKEPRGVRFLMDANAPNVVTSLIYIGAPFVYGDSKLDQERNLEIRPYQNPSTGLVDFYIHFPVNTEEEEWTNFFLRGLIANEKTILQIGNRPFTFIRKVLPQLSQQPQFVLNLPNFRSTYDTDALPSLNTPLPYLLHLSPSVLPNQEPRLLPRGVVIDLNNSQRPSSWLGPPPAGTAYSPTLDIMFSPEGTVTGVEAAAGVIHLVVADQVDTDLGRAPGDPTKEGNERIVSLRTQTGNISVHFVDPTDLVDNSTNAAPKDGIADDPFRYAAIGEIAQ